jgi:glycosyltransferase involved in cell wall biosynthesis
MKKEINNLDSLRILILGNAAPYRIGGAEVQTRRLADAFCLRGHSVTIAGYAMPNIPDTAVLWRSVNVRVRGETRTLRAVSFALALSRLLLRQRNSFDLIYSRVIGESILVAAVLKFLGIISQPMIVSSACAGESGDAAALEILPGRASIVWLINRTCSAINILSPKIEKELRDLGLRRDRFTFIPNGVPASTYALSGQRDYGKQRTFLYVGRLSRQKRVDLLLLAFSLLKENDRCTSLHIVGDGPDKRELVFLAGRLGIANRVFFYGSIAPEEVSSHYSRHTIFLLSSRDEGQPNALLEAMSSGMPVIVTASGGAEYLADETMGFICPQNDPVAVASAMSRMLEMPAEQLARMGALARRKAQSKFDMNDVAQQYLDLFAKLVGKAGWSRQRRN